MSQPINEFRMHTPSRYSAILLNPIMVFIYGILLTGIGVFIDWNEPVIHLAGTFEDGKIGKLISLRGPSEISHQLIGHFLIVLGEATMVFAVVNGFFERIAKENFNRSLEQYFKDESSKLTSKIETAFQNNIFKTILAERTSKEVAEWLFTSGNISEYLKKPTRMEYQFYKEGDCIHSIHIDDGTVKNISKQPCNYGFRLTLTDTDKFSYSLGQVCIGQIGDMKKLNTAVDGDYEEQIDSNNPKIKTYKLKVPEYMSEESELELSRELKMKFNCDDEIEDFFYTKQFVMPFNLVVKLPKDYSFELFPTFKESDTFGPEYLHENEVLYKMPFMTPGQGFSYRLFKS